MATDALLEAEAMIADLPLVTVRLSVADEITTSEKMAMRRGIACGQGLSKDILSLGGFTLIPDGIFL